ncbi:MAG TPA: hypothetical protein VJC37_03965 [Planctomycetota bacterium]|nr:hypothetical protein [Planctomycetota bacterium]
MRNIIMLLVGISALVVVEGCAKYDQPVYGLLPPIACQYFKCDKCNSYDGGIYGKGPLNHYSSAKAKKCVHQWREIAIQDFAIGISKDFNVDWSKETPWWQRLDEYVSKKDLTNHPLNHADFKIIDRPRSQWVQGWMHHNQVMAYIFKSDAERNLANAKLLEAGYGEDKTNYIYTNNYDITVNGTIFPDIKGAKKYIKDKKITKILYTDGEESFPETIPDEIKIKGVEFWLIDWRK